MPEKDLAEIQTIYNNHMSFSLEINVKAAMIANKFCQMSHSLGSN